MNTVRADRFLTLRVAAPLMALARTRALRIPILMYHSISRDIDEHDIHPYYRIATTPEVFNQHMTFLSNQGYQAVSLDFAVKYLRKEHGLYESLPTKPVVITFDDGLRDFYINAFPILDKYGFSATVFLPAAMIKDRPATVERKERMAWQEVKALHKEGIIFGSHTMTHAQLRTMWIKEIEFELKCSKDTIEDKLGIAVESFSYPYAFPEGYSSFVAYLLKALRKCGYKNGVSTRIGVATPEGNDLFLKRIPVNSCDDNELFHAKLAGAYDWLSYIQHASKSLSAKLGWCLNRLS
ncbi:MAG: polysaccharide deacetylase family protein [Nitrospirota bacterium]